MFPRPLSLERILGQAVCVSALLVFGSSCADASNPVAFELQQEVWSQPTGVHYTGSGLRFSELSVDNSLLMSPAEHDLTSEELGVGRTFPPSHPYYSMCAGAALGGCRYVFDSWANQRPMTLEGLFASCVTGAATAFCAEAPFNVQSNLTSLKGALKTDCVPLSSQELLVLETITD